MCLNIIFFFLIILASCDVILVVITPAIPLIILIGIALIAPTPVPNNAALTVLHIIVVTPLILIQALKAVNKALYFFNFFYNNFPILAFHHLTLEFYLV